MRFGPVPLAEAEGAILAHSHPVPGGWLRKGSVLTADHIAALAAAGNDPVVVARLEAGDLDENTAALALAKALVPDPGAAGLRLGRAATGRVNLFAAGPGVLRVDGAKIAALNGVDPALTVATLAADTQVQAEQMIATVKVITYGIAADLVSQAARAGAGALTRASPRLSRVALIETTLEQGTSPKALRVLTDRLDRLNASLSAHLVVPHRSEEVATALDQLGHTDVEVILILTASATSDPRDVAPAGLVSAGGQVTRFGMPVDPGNLLFLGSLGTIPVIGLPGCARSPSLNGADFVLSRVICGVPVDDQDIAAMGVGGLLKDVAQRGRPRDANEAG